MLSANCQVVNGVTCRSDRRLKGFANVRTKLSRRRSKLSRFRRESFDRGRVSQVGKRERNDRSIGRSGDPLVLIIASSSSKIAFPHLSGSYFVRIFVLTSSAPQHLTVIQGSADNICTKDLDLPPPIWPRSSDSDGRFGHLSKPWMRRTAQFSYLRQVL